MQSTQMLIRLTGKFHQFWSALVIPIGCNRFGCGFRDFYNVSNGPEPLVFDQNFQLVN